jgi:hypothetical protein
MLLSSNIVANSLYFIFIQKTIGFQWAKVLFLGDIHKFFQRKAKKGHPGKTRVAIFLIPDVGGII